MDGQFSLGPAVQEAWRAYDKAAGRSVCVSPAAPILFFGDLRAYASSNPRVLTVGLNPSRREFPEDRPFSRFPLCAGPAGREPERYLEALASYFVTHPYRAWFRAFEPILNGMGASYYPGETATALHTDICSPIATDPTWSGLGPADRSALETDGGPLWHTLLTALKPEVVVLSVAQRHLERIEFQPLDCRWQVIRTFCWKRSGQPRSRPYEARGRWHDIGGAPSLFVFGPAAQTPFGLISQVQKRELGSTALEAYRNGR